MAYSVVSLFSGAGFLDIGFQDNGFDVVWGCELVPKFADVHNYNWKLHYGVLPRVIAQDITTISARDVPRALGIIGGPPCQDFSIANANNPGVMGERGQLVWDYLGKIESLQPDFFLFENVDTISRVHKHRVEAFDPLIQKFKEIGYWVDARTLNAMEYGIPQDRSRVVIVGFRQSLIELLIRHNQPVFQWPTPLFPNAKQLFSWAPSWPFETDVDELEWIARLGTGYRLTVHHAIGSEDELTALPNHVAFRPYSDKFGHIPEGEDRRKSFKRLHRFRYSPTVAYGNNEVHLHPTKRRRLTVREALRLQSVPDWYEFPEETPLGHMFKMVSNGVPCTLAGLLARQIRAVLDTRERLQARLNRLPAIIQR